MTDRDDHDLNRFVAAQRDTFDSAIAELRAGRKTSHWMWFVFPQIAGLGSSATARHYAIRDIEEARAYLAHPLLGPRLRAAAAAILAAPGSAEAILGPVDAMKLRSSMTLFAAAEAEDRIFAQVLDRLYAGRPDAETLRRLGMRD